jgi:hypothetical protein
MRPVRTPRSTRTQTSFTEDATQRPKADGLHWVTPHNVNGIRAPVSCTGVLPARRTRLPGRLGRRPSPSHCAADAGPSQAAAQPHRTHPSPASSRAACPGAQRRARTPFAALRVHTKGYRRPARGPPGPTSAGAAPAAAAVSAPLRRRRPRAVKVRVTETRIHNSTVTGIALAGPMQLR